MSSLDRVLLYLIGFVVLPIAGFSIGLGYFDRICDENDPEVTECDLGAVYGFAGGLIALGVFVVLLITLEATAAVAARRRS